MFLEVLAGLFRAFAGMGTWKTASALSGCFVKKAAKTAR
jgi:hypothetical protein